MNLSCSSTFEGGAVSAQQAAGALDVLMQYFRMGSSATICGDIGIHARCQEEIAGKRLCG
ncbi:hypothetical protein VNI00_016204 [Paramarasmius palmivorus]|uniref:Uncharacterized protein n=1 Tax=Paramarasmius palmivorus TaxID=297713 RepID=A0AAW0BED1_9AGAR